MKSAPAKILIIQLRRIGDVIVTTPVIDALRAAFPEARIDFLVESDGAPVLRNNPGLNEAVVFDRKNFLRHLMDIRARGYDWALDFMNNPRTAQIVLASGAALRAGFRAPFWEFVYTHRVARAAVPQYNVQHKFDLLRALGLTPPAVQWPKIYLEEADFTRARAWWEEKGLGRFSQRVGLAPTHRHAVRRWPLEKFAGVAERLLSAPDRALIVFCGPGEEGYIAPLLSRFPERVYAIPRLALRESAALLSLCDALATNDSGAMHLAVSVGTPTVTVYGPTSHVNWNPGPPHRRVLARGLACLGCNLDRCPYAHECMAWVSPDRMAAEVEALLRARAGVPGV